LKTYELSSGEKQSFDPFLFYRSEQTVFIEADFASFIFKKTKSGLAFVLAHEIAHSKDLTILRIILGCVYFFVTWFLTLWSLRSYGWFGWLVTFCALTFVLNLVSSKLARQTEFKADKLAIKLVYTAGFDTKEAILWMEIFFSLCEKLVAEEKKFTFKLTEDHPKGIDRIAMMRQTFIECNS